ncbi:MAG TPA: hypothetical protein VII69_13975, partial [Candidatus Eremiobacteraceae bacterium]
GAFVWMTAARTRELMRSGPVAVWKLGRSGVSIQQDVKLDRLPRSRYGVADAHAFNGARSTLDYSGPAPPQGSLVVLHQHSSGGWQASVDGFVLAPYPADGFAQGWIVDRPGTLAVRYVAPPISLLWFIVFFAIAAAIAMAFVRPKIGPID